MSKNAPGRLYCKECGQNEAADKFKIMQCRDCGIDIVVGLLNTKTCRCDECQDKANKERYNRYNAKRRF
jgi:hypothetical protein